MSIVEAIGSGGRQIESRQGGRNAVALSADFVVLLNLSQIKIYLEIYRIYFIKYIFTLVSLVLKNRFLLDTWLIYLPKLKKIKGGIAFKKNFS